MYYVTGNLMFPTQIIVTGQLDKKHQWLRVLSAHAKEEDIINFAYASKKLTTQGEHNNVDAVYQISVMANIKVYEDLKRRAPLMCEALKYLMRDELEESMEHGIEKGIEKGNDLILQLKNGATNEELLQNGYTLEAIKNAKETLKLILE